MSLTKNIALTSVLVAALGSTSVFAYGTPYIGAQLGYGTTHIKKDFNTSGVSVDENGLAGRIYAGYPVISDMFAVELGYAKYSDVTIKIDDGPNSKLKTSAIDLLGVVRVPVANDSFSINAKAGAAYVMHSVKTSGFSSDTDRNFRPKVAVGADYNLNDNVAVGVAYDYTFGTGTSNENHYNPDLSILSANVTYSF